MPIRSPSTAGPAPCWAVQVYRRTATRTVSARPAWRSRRRWPRSSLQIRRRWRSQDWRLSRRGREVAPCMRSCDGSTSSGHRAHRWARCRSVFTHVWNEREGAGQSLGKGDMHNARGGILVPTTATANLPIRDHEEFHSILFEPRHQLSSNSASSRHQNQAPCSSSRLASRPAHSYSRSLPGLRRS